MAKAQQQKPADAPVPTHLKMSAEAFDNAGGEIFGGASAILHPAEGDIVGPLTYLGFRAGVELGNGLAPVDIHEAKDGEGNQYRLPISANFKRQMELADLAMGDKFAIRRLPDVVKQRGAGAGNAMEMYQVQVLSKVARAAAAV